MYQEPNKQGMRKVHMMVTVTTTPNWHSQLTTWKDRSYTSATSEKWCHEQYKHLFGHLKELRPNAYSGDEYSDRLFKNETKISISEDEKKAVIIIQTQMEYWLTTVAANH
jgi:hypothetical protein